VKTRLHNVAQQVSGGWFETMQNASPVCVWLCMVGVKSIQANVQWVCDQPTGNVPGKKWHRSAVFGCVDAFNLSWKIGWVHVL